MRIPRMTTLWVMVGITLSVSGFAGSRTEARAVDAEKERTVTEIKKLGGEVQREMIGGKFLVNFRGSKFGDAGLARLKGLENIRDLDLSGTRVSDAGMVHLKSHRLNALELANTQVSDAGLAQLVHLTGLRVLNLSGTRVSDAGLVHLKGMELRVLKLANTQVSDAGLAHLTDLDHLVDLDLNHTRVTNAGIERLQRALPDVDILGRDEVPYFPRGVFGDEDRENDDEVARLYGKYLRKMEEPSLWKLAKDDHAATVYRLLWVPSFHHGISVRIVKSRGSFTLHAVELDGRNDVQPGKIAIKKSVKLSQERWDEFSRRLDKAKFWGSSTIKKAVINPDFGPLLGRNDGDNLILEGVSEGKYHVVDRWDAEPEYESLCRYMLFDLSGLKVREAWDDYHD